MQLVEQGKLNLDTDVNNYLDFQIRPAFHQPVTLRNLMTHTGGFEETINDIIFTDPKEAVSIRDYLIRNQPMRIYPPGEVPAYSNYGVGLASYIVQRASGEPFEQYVQEHIFAPLGMTHSSFYQPLQKSLAGLPSQGYRSNTTKPAVGFEIFNPVGAGGISSSAADMGRSGTGSAQRRRTGRQTHSQTGDIGPDVDAAISRQRSDAADLHGVLSGLAQRASLDRP